MDETPAEQATATLYINLTDSRCGGCGKPADPDEDAHISKLGYKPGEGCGAVFTHVSSDYHGVDERAGEMRPDLELIPTGFNF